MNKDSLHFYQFVRDFLTVYLPMQKASSPNTIKSYKDTLNIFPEYLKSEQKIPLKSVGFKNFYICRKGTRCAMSPDNVEKFIKRYGRQAREKNVNVPVHLYPHMFRHSRAMHLYRNGMPLPLLAEWLGYVQMETTIQYYANADTQMKKEAIEKATTELNPLFQDNPEIDWENDEEMIKKLHGVRGR